MRRLLFAPLLAFLLLLVGCSDDLRKVADANHKLSEVMPKIREATIAANAAGQLSDADAFKIRDICIKIDHAGKEASTVTRAYTQLDPGAKVSISAIVTPLLAAVDNALSSGLAGVSDPNVAANIRGLLNTARAALAVIQAIVGTQSANQFHHLEVAWQA